VSLFRLTDAGSVSRATITATAPGMAHFATTGPDGAVCGSCAHYAGHWRQWRKLSRSTLVLPVPPESAACRHYGKAEGRPLPFRLAVEDDFIMAPIRERRLERDLAMLAASGYRAGGLLADVPWSFLTWSDRGKGRSAERHYPAMTIAEIAALGPLIQVVTADDSCLFFWVTQPLLFEAKDIMRAWHYDYRSIAFTWGKVGTSGKPQIGLGYWTRQASEVCLLGIRGQPRRLDKGVGQLVLAPRTSHSAKPREIHDRIRRLVAGPYLELFGRERALGWDVLGTLEGVPE
jgi:N6-adenosine-specific RNA methylase IME4